MSTVKDLVCGMRVDPQTTPHHVLHGEHKHYFCSAECAAKFVADPEKYGHPLTPTQSNHAISHDEELTNVTLQEDTQALYICPMHPEVQQIGPGTCPKCGMALEPEAESL